MLNTHKFHGQNCKKKKAWQLHIFNAYLQFCLLTPALMSHIYLHTKNLNVLPVVNNRIRQNLQASPASLTKAEVNSVQADMQKQINRFVQAGSKEQFICKSGIYFCKIISRLSVSHFKCSHDAQNRCENKKKGSSCYP